MQSTTKTQDKILTVGCEPTPSESANRASRSDFIAPVHTPGPWRVKRRPESSWSIYGAGTRGSICNVKPIDAERQEANASLIAAAPLLLSALHSLITVTRSHLCDPEDGEPGYSREDVLAYCAEARASIAAALGEPS